MRYSPGRGTLFAALWCCLCGRGQRGNNATHLVHSSPTFQWTLLWDWEFLPVWNPSQYFTTRGFESLVSCLASPTSPMQSTALLWVFSAAAYLPYPPLLPDLVNVSLTPWLLELYAVRFSHTSGCLLFLNWLLSFFWLCEEASVSTYASLLARTHQVT